MKYILKDCSSKVNSGNSFFDAEINNKTSIFNIIYIEVNYERNIRNRKTK